MSPVVIKDLDYSSFRPVNRVVLTIPGACDGDAQAHQGLPGPCMVRPDPLPFLGSLIPWVKGGGFALRADGREKGPFPASLGPHQHCMTPAVESPYILPTQKHVLVRNFHKPGEINQMANI